jgi:hypothetical protein
MESKTHPTLTPEIAEKKLNKYNANLKGKIRHLYNVFVMNEKPCFATNKQLFDSLVRKYLEIQYGDVHTLAFLETMPNFSILLARQNKNPSAFFN